MSHSITTPLLGQSRPASQRSCLQNARLTFTFCVGAVCTILSLASFILMINESINDKCNNGPLKIAVSSLSFGSSVAIVLGLAVSFFGCRSFQRRAQDLERAGDRFVVGERRTGLGRVIGEDAGPRHASSGDLAIATVPSSGAFTPEQITRLVDELGQMEPTAAGARMLSLVPDMLTHLHPDVDVQALTGRIFSLRVVPRAAGSCAGTSSVIGSPPRELESD